MGKRHIKLQSDKTAEINMSPMVDMIFLLLIFFMVTTVFTKDAALDISRPKAQTAQPAHDDAMIIVLTAQGVIRHNGQVYQLAQIPALVREQLDGNGRITVVSDQAAPTGLTIQLLDQCRLGGITDISIAATSGNGGSND